MNIYVLAGWFACLSTTILLMHIFRRKRFLFVKPSVIVVLFYHFQIQWAATVDAAYIQSYLPEPWVFFLLCQGFPLIGLLISMQMWRGTASRIWGRIVQPQQENASPRYDATIWLLVLVILFTGYYLFTVPFASTGLYALFVDPANYVMAREGSLKLVESNLVKYGYVLTAKTIVPILGVLLSSQLLRSAGLRRLVNGILLLGVIVSLLMVVSLSGARGFSAGVVLTIAVAWLLRKGFSINLTRVMLFGLIVVLVPALITIVRSGRLLGFSSFWEVYSTTMVDRVFYDPMRTGLYYAHFAQTVEFLGARAIPKLAELMGIQAISAGNMLGLMYSGSSVSSIFMNTGYVHSYYAYFGLIAFPFCLVALWLLDFALSVFSRIRDNQLLLACVATVMVACSTFISTDYTTALVSGGVGPALVIALILDMLVVNRPRRALYDAGLPKSEVEVTGATKVYTRNLE